MRCGKCGAEIGGHLGPCPSCNDKPFGDAVKRTKRPVCGVCQRPCQHCKEYHERIRRQNPLLARRIEDAHKDEPGNIHEAWWSCQQDLLKIKELMRGFEDDDKDYDDDKICDRLNAIWEIVKGYGERT